MLVRPVPVMRPMVTVPEVMRLSISVSESEKSAGDELMPMVLASASGCRMMPAEPAMTTPETLTSGAVMVRKPLAIEPPRLSVGIEAMVTPAPPLKVSVPPTFARMSISPDEATWASPLAPTVLRTKFFAPVSVPVLIVALLPSVLSATLVPVTSVVCTSMLPVVAVSERLPPMNEDGFTVIAELLVIVTLPPGTVESVSVPALWSWASVMFPPGPAANEAAPVRTTPVDEMPPPEVSENAPFVATCARATEDCAMMVMGPAASAVSALLRLRAVMVPPKVLAEEPIIIAAPPGWRVTNVELPVTSRSPLPVRVPEDRRSRLPPTVSVPKESAPALSSVRSPRTPDVASVPILLPIVALPEERFRASVPPVTSVPAWLSCTPCEVSVSVRAPANVSAPLKRMTSPRMRRFVFSADRSMLPDEPMSTVPVPPAAPMVSNEPAGSTRLPSVAAERLKSPAPLLTRISDAALSGRRSMPPAPPVTSAEAENVEPCTRMFAPPPVVRVAFTAIAPVCSSVALPPAVFTVPPTACVYPTPEEANEPPLVAIAPLIVTSPAAEFGSTLPPPLVLACKSTLRWPAVEVIVELTTTLFAARSVNVASAPAVLLTAALTLMLPASVPTLPVMTVTFVPLLSAALMVATSTIAGDTELSGSHVVVPPEVLVVVPAVGLASMLTLTGSIIHSPPLPPRARALAVTDAPRMSRLILPEVSMKPPSPERVPPRAETSP